MNQTDKLAVTRGMPQQIRTLSDCRAGVEWIRQAEDFVEAVESLHKESISLAHKAHKAAIAAKNEQLGQLPEQIEIARGMVKSYASEGCELPEGVSTRIKWKVKVVDASLVPREFCCPDLKELERFAGMSNGCIPVEGVEWVEEVSVAIKSEA